MRKRGPQTRGLAREVQRFPVVLFRKLEPALIEAAIGRELKGASVSGWAPFYKCPECGYSCSSLPFVARERPLFNASKSMCSCNCFLYAVIGTESPLIDAPKTCLVQRIPMRDLQPRCKGLNDVMEGLVRIE